MKIASRTIFPLLGERESRSQNGHAASAFLSASRADNLPRGWNWRLGCRLRQQAGSLRHVAATTPPTRNQSAPESRRPALFRSRCSSTNHTSGTARDIPGCSEISWPPTQFRPTPHALFRRGRRGAAEGPPACAFHAWRGSSGPVQRLVRDTRRSRHSMT